VRTLGLAAASILLLAVVAGPLVYAQSTYTCDAVYYEVLPDGSVFVNMTFTVAEAPTQIVIEPEAPPILAWALDEAGKFLPIEFNDTLITVSVYEPSKVNVTYYTQALTSKAGPYWELTLNPGCKAYVILPGDAVPITVEPANPEAALVNGKLALVFDPGTVKITYMLVPEVPPATTAPAPTTPPPTTTATGGETGTAPATTETSGIPAGAETGTAGGEGGGLNWIIPAILLLAAIAVALYFFRSRSQPSSQGGAEAQVAVAPRTPLDERDRKILEALREGPKTAGELMQETGIPKTPLYRRLKRMMEEGLIEAVEEEGVRKYRLRE